MSSRLFIAFTSLCFLGACQGDPNEPAEQGTSPLEACLEGSALEEAERPAGMTGEASAIVPMGRAVTPVGVVATIGRWPLAGAFSPSGDEAYVVHNGTYQLSVMNPVTGAVRYVVPGVGGFRGILVDRDGEWIITADASEGRVSRLERVGKDGRWDVATNADLPGAPTSLAYSVKDHRVIAVSGLSSKVWELDPEDLSVLDEYASHGIYPYGIVVDPDGEHIYFTHAGDDKVTKVSRSTGETVKHVRVGLNPMGMAVDPSRGLLYVANTDSDSISVLRMSPFELLRTVDVTTLAGVPGGTPNELLVSPDGTRLFVSFADLNMVRVYSLPQIELLGAIPTGFYPTGLAATADGATMMIASSKGWGATKKLHSWPGVVSFVPMKPSPETLAAWTEAADSNVTRATEFFSDSDCAQALPLPLDPDEEQVIEHVVVIVRENKTYDAVLGDLEVGDGDPALTVFGEEFTPNLHRLAREFVNLDNYYADSEESVQGHTWTTQADCNDLFEKLYPADFNQFILPGVDPSSIHAERSIFDHCWLNGVTFRNYGEFESFTKELFGDWEAFINPKFPYYNLSIPDVWKAKEFVRELELGIFPEFVYIALPNDHTAGGKAGMPTPASMVADNDEGTGIIVDAISHSPYWDSSIVFIIQDDPQGYGGDHVHSHRSVCVVASPWVRRNHVSSVHYSIPAMYRTIEMLLRLPPMNLNTGLAPPMLDIFLPRGEEEQMDPTAYDVIPRLIPEEFNRSDAAQAAASAGIATERVDGAKGLGEIIWRIQKGDVDPPPYAKWSDD
ncbi:MAG: bifunctional YncE family protein/alkaline phosphatase family protein [Pseudomonadota bacterium]